MQQIFKLKQFSVNKDFLMSSLSNSGRAETTVQQRPGEVFRKTRLVRFTEKVREKFKEGLGNVQSLRVERCEEKDGI